MHTLVGQHAAPEARGFNADLAHFYGLPCFGIGGVSGSKTADEQAALESALTLLEAAQSGAQLIHDVGYLDNGLTGSLEQLVICHEIIGWIRQYLWDLTIDAETLALDVIAAVGPDGQFIETEHTLRHVREDWYPGLLARGTYDAWVKDGSRTLRERAAGKVDALLASWAPRAPQPAVTRAWEEITGLGGGGSQS
jgi:trimethylamine--corrinoid protein Co-methyltransferase